MKFVLQNTEVLYDFQNEVYLQKRYYDWLNTGKSDELKTEFFVLNEKDLRNAIPESEWSGWCPVGSVEYCVDWYKRVWNKTPLPINVPEELKSLCTRKIIEMRQESTESLRGGTIFIKDTNKIKSGWNGFKDKTDNMWYYDSDHIPHFHFQASEEIPNILSEWRCFVLEGKLIDIKNYLGDPFIVPDKNYIKSAISKYSRAPIAYTLDVACCEGYHEIIEVHDFFACGLYGFSDRKYPIMLWRWFKEFTTKIN